MIVPLTHLPVASEAAFQADGDEAHKSSFTSLCKTSS
jgi:hypothetical protein